MNDWMVPKLTWDDNFRPDRGKVLHATDFDAGKTFFRYLDVDGDGIPYRTLPGEHPKGAYFTRGSGHNKFGAYTEISEEYVEVVDRVAAKIESAAEFVPAPITKHNNSRIGLISIGGCDGAATEALDKLADRGQQLDYLRVRGFPFGKAVREFLQSHDKCYVAEQNRSGQLRHMLASETGYPLDRLIPILNYSGYPMSADIIIEGVLAKAEVSA